MRLLIALLSAVLMPSAATAGQTLWSASWNDPNLARSLQNGHLLPGDVLEIGSTSGAESTLPIFEISDPGITQAVYAIAGEVRCENLGGLGYLEMWSRFPEGGEYFSRTLGRGPLAPLQGSSDWRPFVLPFFNRPGNAAPARLSFGAHLPGTGRILVRAVRVVQYAAGEDPTRAQGQWWSGRDSGTIGGIAGSVLGLLGALIGALAGSGRARGVVFGALRLMQAIGVGALALGVFALFRAQPYAVTYPLLLIGVMATVLPTVLTGTLRKRYEASELRRMAALDLRS
jgi:hypothetical protein